jgi:hypothetical protein
MSSCEESQAKDMYTCLGYLNGVCGVEEFVDCSLVTFWTGYQKCQQFTRERNLLCKVGVTLVIAVRDKEGSGELALLIHNSAST